jgi:hypothetical protein
VVGYVVFVLVDNNYFFGLLGNRTIADCFDIRFYLVSFAEDFDNYFDLARFVEGFDNYFCLVSFVDNHVLY